MPKRKPTLNQNQSPSLKEFLDTYDQRSLLGALNSFEASLGWEVLKAYARMVQRENEITALDLIPKEDMVQAASYASGYAKGVSDLVEQFVPGLQKTITQVSPVIENDRPEE